MLFEVFFRLIVGIFASIVEIILPVLPSGFTQILNTIWNYIDTGLKFVWIFVPQNLVLQLFSWWLTVVGMLLTMELCIEVWRLITGNIGGQDATTDPSGNNTQSRKSAH